MNHLIPKPFSVTRAEGAYRFSPVSAIVVPPESPAIGWVAAFLADRLLAGGQNVPLVEATEHGPGQIALRLIDSPAPQPLGAEGYRLKIDPDGVMLEAEQPAGLFYAVQTLRQLLPPGKPLSGVLSLPAGEIIDYPRFAWRGAMLDVSRHFFSVDDVKRYMDLLATYKMNRLHLHLSDDQGWRIEIKSWPQLALVGGSTAVNGEGGGYYTQEQYADLAAYAAQRNITIVPEIDLPGHTNAALAAYAELNCDGVAQPLYTGITVGFSSLCIDKENTYTFLDDVIRELAAITPGPYIHIGGDEAMATPPDAYKRFMVRVQPIVQKYGKQVIGWEELGQAPLLPGTLVQQWNSEPSRTVHTLEAVAQGAKVIVSPSSRIYLDMKYTADFPLGLQWAGLVEVRDAYDWDPSSYLAGVSEEQIAGVEAPLWAETLRTIDEVELMAFPRLVGVAEIGWSPREGRHWEEYRTRLAAHAPCWEVRGVNFYRSPQVDWR